MTRKTRSILARTLALCGIALMVTGISAGRRLTPTPPGVHTGWHGDPAAGWLPCDDKKPVKPSAAVTIFHADYDSIKNVLTPASGAVNNAQVIRDMYRAAFATCFLDSFDPGGPTVNNVPQYNQSQDSVVGNGVVVRLRPAHFAHQMKHQGDLAPGTGYFVADLHTLLGTRDTGAHDANGVEVTVDVGSSTLLWIGMADNKQAYYAEIDLHSFPNVSPDDGLGVTFLRRGHLFPAYHGKKYNAAFARFHEPPSGGVAQKDIPDGTWITCSIGCCVANSMTVIQ